jgi:uncharacterized protein (TIGR02270 family)
MMVKTSVEFSRRLYGDHLEEIEFLLAQRIGLFHDPEVQWPQIEDFENRLMAHVDGIILGGKDADALSIELLDSDDIDIVRGAAYALAHSESPDALGVVVQKMEQTPSELLPAYVDALKHPPNDRISEKLTDLLSHAHPEIRTSAIEILGYRREGNAEQIAGCLEDSNPAITAAAALAVTRLRYDGAVHQLRRALKHPATSAVAEAAFALATFGAPEGLNWFRSFCVEPQEDCGFAPVYLALAGSVSDSDLILRSPVAAMKSGIEALGIIGDPEVFGKLHEALNSDDEEIKLAAAESLELITGSGLVEEYTHVEKFEDPDEGVIETDEAVRTRVSSSHEAWSDWLAKHGGGFATGTRYRCGKQFALSLLLDEIADPKSSFTRRKRAYLELLARGGQVTPFEPDWFIRRQRKTLTG